MVLVLAEDRESNLSRADMYTYEDTNITGSPCGSFGRDANSQHLHSHFVNLWFKPHRRILFFLSSSYSIYCVSFIFDGLFRTYILNVCDFISFISALHTIYFKMMTLLFHHGD